MIKLLAATSFIRRRVHGDDQAGPLRARADPLPRIRWYS
jgi:hypothetical protein